MQDVDFELVYEPGKDENDPLDYNSRHPLPIVGSDDVEKVVKHMIVIEHATVLEKIQSATKHDDVLQKVMQVIQNGDWESCRRDPVMSSYYAVRNELYIAENLVLRLNQIVIPSSLQRKVIKTAHKMGPVSYTHLTLPTKA